MKDFNFADVNYDLLWDVYEKKLFDPSEICYKKVWEGSWYKPSDVHKRTWVMSYFFSILVSDPTGSLLISTKEFELNENEVIHLTAHFDRKREFIIGQLYAAIRGVCYVINNTNDEAIVREWMRRFFVQVSQNKIVEIRFSRLISLCNGEHEKKFYPVWLVRLMNEGVGVVEKVDLSDIDTEI